MNVPAQPAPAAPEKKSKKKGCLIAGCGGCFLLTVLCCGSGGYVGYLEEGVSYSDPGEEVHSQPFLPATPFEVSVEWDGTGYADHRLYLDLPGAAEGTRVTGQVDCSDYREPTPRSFDETYHGSYGDTPAGWIRIDEEYARSPGTVRCRGTLITDPPAVGRLVVTRKQRPSDWIAGF